MSNPTKVPMRLTRGDDAKISLTISVDNDPNTPQNLTGWTVASQIRASADSAVSLADWTVTVSAPATGVAVLTLGHAVTAALPEDCVYDVQLTSPAGLVETIISGPVKVTRDVTRG